MDTLVEKLDAKLRQWRPEIAEQVRQHVAEIIELADLDALDVMRSRAVEQEVLDHLGGSFRGAKRHCREMVIYSGERVLCSARQPWPLGRRWHPRRGVFPPLSQEATGAVLALVGYRPELVTAFGIQASASH